MVQMVMWKGGKCGLCEAKLQFSKYMIAIYRLSSYIGSMIATHGSHDLKSKLCFFHLWL